MGRRGDWLLRSRSIWSLGGWGKGKGPGAARGRVPGPKIRWEGKEAAQRRKRKAR